MGTDFYAACDTCKVYSNCGYGSYGTWLTSWSWKDDSTTLEGYDLAAALPENVNIAKYEKNRNIRAFLVDHNDHGKLQLICGDSDIWGDDDSVQWKYDEVSHPYQFGCSNCVEGSHQGPATDFGD